MDIFIFLSLDLPFIYKIHVVLGIIQKQSLKFTAVNFVGTFIGFMSVIFIYPREQELYGYFQFLFSAAMLLVPVLGLGMSSAIIKYYPIFVQKNRDRNFLSFTVALATISAVFLTLVLGMLYYLFQDYIASVLSNFDLVKANLQYILILTYLNLYAGIFLNQAIARYSLVIPDLIYTFSLKIFLPFIIICVYLGWLDRVWFPVYILLYYLIVMLALLVYIMYLDKHSLNPKLLSFNKAEYTALGSFMTFSLFNGLGASLALRLDNVMIGSMLTVNAVYIYGTILTISNVIEIPSKAINNISSAVISSSWTNNDQANIQDIYQKSSVYGWIVGLLLFLLIYFIWIDIIALMPGKIQMELSSILLIFTLLSFARIIDLVTGVNSVILSYSSLYKYHMYFLIILGVVNIVLNYFLIQRLGIAGAALATCISYVIFNLMKYYFLKSRFGFSIHWQPHTAVLVAGLIVFVIMHVLTFSFLPVINIVLKSIITSVLFGTLILIFNPGGEIRALADSYIRKFVRK